MAKNTRLATMVVDAQANVLGDLLKNGFIDIFDGKQPDSADVPLDAQKLCVSLRLGAPAFRPSKNGTIASEPILSGVSEAVQNASWARCYREDHKSPVMDVSVGTTEDFNLTLPTTNIPRGVTVLCSSFVHSISKSSPGA